VKFHKENEMSDTTEKSAKKTTKASKATKSTRVSKKQADIAFSNFDSIDFKLLTIDVFKFLNPDNEEEFVYNASLTLLLDLEEPSGLTLPTSVYNECPHCCAREALALAIQLADDRIANSISVFDENFDEIGEFVADELFHEIYGIDDEPVDKNNDSSEVSVVIPQKPNKTIH
jgi:hypothetical protein